MEIHTQVARFAWENDSFGRGAWNIVWELAQHALTTYIATLKFGKHGSFFYWDNNDQLTKWKVTGVSCHISVLLTHRCGNYSGNKIWENYSTWCWGWDIKLELDQYHSYWCPGDLCHHGISSHGINKIIQTGLYQLELEFQLIMSWQCWEKYKRLINILVSSH